MKKKALAFIALLAILTSLYVLASDRIGSDAIRASELKPLSYQSEVEIGVGLLLEENSYRKRNIDNKLSSEMLDRYLDEFDKSRFYFLQADIDEFEKYRFELDDAIRKGDLSGAFFIFERFLQRFKERHAYVLELLSKDFDFTVDEYFDLDREDKPWPKTRSELDDVWRKRIKHELLSLLVTGKEKSAAVETLKKRYESTYRRILQTESEDVFSYYLNAFAGTFDPHTGYMSPKASDDFSINMSKSLEGIGASLRLNDEYTTVIEIVPGGPADKSGLLHPNDRIVGVGQGDNGEIVDVIGWRIDEVVQLIRGPKDSKVRLQILPADASVYSEPKVIEIIRDKVKLADRVAKSEIQEMQYRGKPLKIGIIKIPDFYFDYESMRKGDPDYASTSGDVKKLLANLMKASVDGVIVDLRNNGGGFLSEAINLTGLFIKDGPVVQVRSSKGKISEELDPDPDIYYEGPLVVLVDRLSASASEIFAGAIQDYQRGIIVGGRTFGKGTVQNLVRLDQLDRLFPDNKEKLGQLRLTIAKFYRVNGSSTQHVGVTPDIQFPSRYEAMDIGESALDNALLWDQIKGTEFSPFQSPVRGTISELERRHEERAGKDPEFRYMKEDLAQFLKQKENTRVSLQMDKREKEKEEEDAREKVRTAERQKNGGEEEDPFLTETENILGDYVLVSRQDPQSRTVSTSPSVH